MRSSEKRQQLPKRCPFLPASAMRAAPLPAPAGFRCDSGPSLKRSPRAASRRAREAVRRTGTQPGPRFGHGETAERRRRTQRRMKQSCIPCAVTRSSNRRLDRRADEQAAVVARHEIRSGNPGRAAHESRRCSQREHLAFDRHDRRHAIAWYAGQLCRPRTAGVHDRAGGNEAAIDGHAEHAAPVAFDRQLLVRSMRTPRERQAADNARPAAGCRRGLRFV